jgi:hypothetical protein
MNWTDMYIKSQWRHSVAASPDQSLNSPTMGWTSKKRTIRSESPASIVS